MSVSLTFRCPDDLAALIASHAEATGQDKTSVIVGMLRSSLSSSPLPDKPQPSPAPVDIDEVVKRQVEQALTDSQLLKDMIALNSSHLTMGIDKIEQELRGQLGTLRSQLEELRGKSKAR